MYYFIFFILSAVWGSNFFLMKQAGFAFGPISIGATTTAGGALILWIIYLISKGKWEFKKKHITPLLLVAVFGYALPFSMQPFLISKIGHGFIGMMVSLVPILTILVSIPMLRCYPSRTQLIGVLVGIVSLVLIMIDGLDRNAKPLYLLLALIVPLFYAIANTLVQKNLSDVPSLHLATLLMTISGVVLIPLAMTF